MIYFYKIQDNKIQRGSGYKVPKGFLEYTKGQEPQELLDILKEQEFTKALYTKLKELETSYNNSIQQNIDYLDTTFQADFKSQELIKSTLTASGGVLPDGFYWKDLYNNEITVTYEDLQGLAAVIFIRGQSEWLKWQELKKLVSTAVSVNDLDDISWGS